MKNINKPTIIGIIIHNILINTNHQHHQGVQSFYLTDKQYHHENTYLY